MVVACYFVDELLAVLVKPAIFLTSVIAFNCTLHNLSPVIAHRTVIVFDWVSRGKPVFPLNDGIGMTKVMVHNPTEPPLVFTKHNAGMFYANNSIDFHPIYNNTRFIGPIQGLWKHIGIRIVV